MFFLIFCFYLSVLYGVFGKLPSAADFEQINQAEATQILDHESKLIGKLYKFDRQKIKYTKLPKHLIDALIATEDARFFEHNGVDKESLLRVLFKTIILGNSSSGGGSTITQQLVKNTFGRENHGTLSIPVVKTKEIILAKRIEKQFSKEEILELYFNTVPFSGNTYGIESASQKFFNKTTQQLQLHEAALLIGTLKANHSYNPKLFPERSKLRRDVVLTQLRKYNYISEEQLEVSLQKPLGLNLKQYNQKSFAGYFVNEVESRAKDFIKNLDEDYNLKTDGLKIYTSLDSQLQEYLENAIQTHLKDLQVAFEKGHQSNPPWENEVFLTKQANKTSFVKKLKKKGMNDAQIKDSLLVKSNRTIFGWNGAETAYISVLDSLAHQFKFLSTSQVAVHPQTGEVKAYVGGIHHQFFPRNNLQKAKRQVGSTFKPILYATALQQGFTPCDYFSNKPITYTNLGDWQPKNAGAKENDPYTNIALKEALAKSLNTISVRLIEEVGIQETIEMAKSMGISSSIKATPSLALGTLELTPFELAKVYAGLVNNNEFGDLSFILKIENQQGEIIYKKPKRNLSKSNLSAENRSQLLEMMKLVVKDGTASRLKSTYGLNYDIAAKTGTTQNNRDGWFVGLLPELVFVSWVGHPFEFGFTSTHVGQGANSALPIYAKTLQQMSKNSTYTAVLNQRFLPISKEIQDNFDCSTKKREGWLKRVFSKDEEERKFKDEEKKKKKGIFSIFKKKD